MEKETFESIRKKGLLLYEYMRGSHSYGLNTAESDIDTGGVFMSPAEQLLGLGKDYQDQVESETHDDVWFEMNKFMNLLLSSNPTVLESLFIPDDCIIYEHPIMTGLKKHRNKFITKKCFVSFGGYAISQIRKARGLNKKIVNPVTERKEPLDFAYTFFRQGSTKIENWLEHRGLYQKYCGLVNIPNMDMTMGVYYDWGNHFLNENVTYKDLYDAYYYTNEDDTIELIHCLKNTDKYGYSEKEKEDIKKRIEFIQLGNMARFICEFYNVNFEINSSFDKTTFEEWFDKQKPIGYKGMVGEDKLSNELRLSSVSKGEKPICYIYYNKDGYSQHCREYKEYKEWEKNRNPERYKSNLNKNYDCYLDSETEFWTNHGWKKYDEITEEDLLGCFNDNHCIEYKPFINRFKDNYTGEIYTHEDSYTKFSVTPNHKLYLSPCHRSPGNLFSTKYNDKDSNWRLIKVEDYFNNKKSYFHQLKCLNNNQEDNLNYSDDFIKILGMFLSEGSYVYGKNTKEPIAIRISQLDGRCGCEVMKSITTIAYKDYIYDKRGKGIEHTYECRDKNVIDKIKECGVVKSLNKILPEFVFSFSKRQVDILLNTMICGDGTYNKKGHKVYYTHSYKLAKGLHTLLLLNGYNAQFYGGIDGYKHCYPSNFKRKDGIITPSYQIFISKYNNLYSVLNKKMATEHKCGWKIKNVVNEKIVCFETEYGTLITRNDEKIAFHGNSKNMMHSFRLLQMCIEIAKGEGFKADRRGIDREFLLDVKNHKYEYDEIIKMLEEKKEEMDKAIAESTIPDKIDENFVNNLLVDIRKRQLGLK